MNYLLLQLFREVRFLRKVLEDPFALVDLLALGSDGGNDASETADIIREGDAADYFDRNDPHGLLGGCGHIISESHCEHNGCCPVIGPNIPLRPRLNIYSLGDLPVAALFEHEVEGDCNRMRKHQVKEKYFYERPIPLVVDLLYQHSLD